MNRDMGPAGLDRQIEKLTDRLREDGAAPENDLWPAIDTAISRTEQATASGNRWTGSGTWRIAALAATVALMIGLGYVGTIGNNNGPAFEADSAAATEPGGPTDLQELDNTLGDLNAALNEDPDNRNLSRLVLLVHKSRASLMKKNSRQWARL